MKMFKKKVARSVSVIALCVTMLINAIPAMASETYIWYDGRDRVRGELETSYRYGVGEAYAEATAYGYPNYKAAVSLYYSDDDGDWCCIESTGFSSEHCLPYPGGCYTQWTDCFLATFYLGNSSNVTLKVENIWG